MGQEAPGGFEEAKLERRRAIKALMQAKALEAEKRAAGWRYVKIANGAYVLRKD